MENNTANKKWIAIIIILVIIALVAFAMPKKAVTPTVDTTTGTPTNTTGSTSTTTPSTTPPVSTALSYKDALAKYQGMIARVTDACSAESTTFTLNLTVGQQVMVANDSTTKTHTVVIDGASYAIAPQHYKILTIKTMGQVYSTCDTKTGITTVAVKPQK